MNYTVKELLAMLERSLTEKMDQINLGVEELGKKLDSKASEVRVDALESRLKKVEDAVVDWKIAAAGPAAVSKYQKALASGVWLLVCSAISALIYLVAAGVHT